MRYLSITLIFCAISITAQAKTWLIDGPNGWKVETTKGFTPKNILQRAPKDNQGEVVMRGDEIDEIEVDEDDLGKPIWGPKTQVQSCSDKDACYELIKTICTGDTTETRVCTGYCTDGSSPFVNKAHTEVYCSKGTGFEQKKVKKWIFSLAKRQARLAVEAAKKTEQQNKVGRENNRINNLKTKYDSFCPTASAPKDQVLCALAKDLMIRHGKETE